MTLLLTTVPHDSAALALAHQAGYQHGLIAGVGICLVFGVMLAFAAVAFCAAASEEPPGPSAKVIPLRLETTFAVERPAAHTEFTVRHRARWPK